MPRKCKSWLNTYLDYVKQTEPPLNYHTWCALSVLGSALKNNIYMKRDFTIYPNQYIILVGHASIGKGTSIRPAYNIARKAGVINYIPDRSTAEAILKKLDIGFSKPGVQQQGSVTIGTIVQDRVATIVSTELPVLLGSSDWMLSFLCDMWDRNEWSYLTKHQGSYEIKGLCTSLLAGCVPDYIRHVTSDNRGFITGGFTSRCIFVYADKPSQEIPFPPTLEGHVLEQDLVDDLRHISLLKGEMCFAPSARTKYELMYRHYGMNGKFEQAVVADFKSRLQKTHLPRLAMLLSACESDSLLIEEYHLNNAAKLLEEVLNNLEEVFKCVGANREQEAALNIKAYIDYKGSTSFEEILRENFRYLENMSEEGLRRILSTMCAMRFCELQGGMYKSTLKAVVRSKTKGGTP